MTTYGRYQKNYYNKHKDEIKLKRQVYYEANKELIDEKLKDYFSRKREELFTCECGTTIKYFSKNKHLASKLHFQTLALLEKNMT